MIMISTIPSVSSVHVELDGRLPSTAGRTDVTTKLSLPPSTSQVSSVEENIAKGQVEEGM